MFVFTAGLRRAGTGSEGGGAGPGREAEASAARFGQVPDGKRADRMPGWLSLVFDLPVADLELCGLGNW